MSWVENFRKIKQRGTSIRDQRVREVPVLHMPHILAQYFFMNNVFFSQYPIFFHVPQFFSKSWHPGFGFGIGPRKTDDVRRYYKVKSVRSFKNFCGNFNFADFSLERQLEPFCELFDLCFLSQNPQKPQNLVPAKISSLKVFNILSIKHYHNPLSFYKKVSFYCW